eukprot:scaffold3421_cov181-Amphora_coffeaeformis.AAC.26
MHYLFGYLCPILFVLSKRSAWTKDSTDSLVRPQETTTTTRLGSSPLETIGETLDQSKYDALLDWVKAQDGAEIHPAVELRPSTLGDGYGAFVGSAVPEGELLFAIPRSACVTLEDGTEDPACGPTYRKLIEKAGPGGNTVVLAGFLATERLRSLEHVKQKQENGQATCANSLFGPYIDTLPWERGTNNQEHILFWEKDDVDALLKGTMAYDEAVSLRGEVELATTVLDGIVRKTIRVFRGEATDDSGFKWPWQVPLEPTTSPGPVKGLPEAVTGAFVSLLTRAFQDGDGDEEKLVPLLDLLQHSDEPNVSHVMRKEDGRVEVRARRTLQPDEELLNQYRSELEESMPYHRFFTRFGFVPGIQEPVQNLLRDKSSIFFAQKAEV